MSLGSGPAVVIVPADATLGDVVGLWGDSLAGAGTPEILWDTEAAAAALQPLGLNDSLTLPLSQLENTTHGLLLWAGLVVVSGPGGDTILSRERVRSGQATRVDSDLLLDGAIADAEFVTTVHASPGSTARESSLRQLADSWGVELSGTEVLVLTGPARQVTELVRTLRAI